MCGRYASFREAQDLADTFDIAPGAVAEDAAGLPPSWNLAPTDPVRIVVERAPRPEPGDGASEAPPEVERSLRLARWGLVPGWAKDPSVGARMINARSESLVDKPAFRKALAVRRCLVPAEGYYEWQQPPAGSPRRTPKQPFWIHPAQDEPMAFAGLYEFWRDRTRADDDPDRWLVTTTIVTASAEGDLAAIHDRRPVVLPRSAWDQWLSPARQDPEGAVALLGRTPPPLLPTAISTAVNKVGTDGPELLAPVEPAG
ncbi:SOS response-associated peptidase [Actinotalea sp. BY-33]|uniref:Abasic site processing protein n=1 Tax=Actinotalea soli TaxID=2819234 RepID=A0A939RUZ0_9CELL|nr:SOS response-associated peptidase [Actinotalea soli]MBO1751855.1 SOS response-associated peptidase [Actinotalea soli]